MNGLLVDITQYSWWPAASGVQRVLNKLALHWPQDSCPSVWAIKRGSSMYGVTPDTFAGISSAIFMMGPCSSDRDISNRSRWVKLQFKKHASHFFKVKEAAYIFDSFHWPEISYERDVLKHIECLRKRMPSSALVYDMIPQTRPDLYSNSSSNLRSNSIGIMSNEYYRCLSKFDRGIFISKNSEQIFERLVLSGFRLQPNMSLASFPLGADGLPKQHAPTIDPTRLVVPGTLEKKKGHEIIIDAMEHLWNLGHNFKLHIVGSDRNIDPQLKSRIAKFERNGKLEWQKKLSDAGLSKAISTAAATVFTSENEGFGLPALESLYLGTPVIASSRLPAIQYCDGGGALLLDRINKETLSTAILEVLKPKTNLLLRQKIVPANLPTWREFSHRVALEASFSNTTPRPRGCGEKERLRKSLSTLHL